MGKPSTKDPQKIAERERTVELLKEVAAVSKIALDAFIQDPRWMGLPGANAISKPSYPRSWANDPYVDPSVKTTSKYGIIKIGEPIDDRTGEEFHIQQIWGFIRRFEAGISSFEYQHDVNGNALFDQPKVKVEGETPYAYMDRIRGALRGEDRLDTDTNIVKTFALMRCTAVGKPTDAGLQEYEYKIFKESEIAIHPTIIDVKMAVRAAFDHVALALMPKNLNERELNFLKWAKEKGGTVRGSEVKLWLKEKGYPRGGQDPASSYLRKFADKTGPARSRKPWLVREEAFVIAGLTP